MSERGGKRGSDTDVIVTQHTQHLPFREVLSLLLNTRWSPDVPPTLSMAGDNALAMLMARAGKAAGVHWGWVRSEASMQTDRNCLFTVKSTLSKLTLRECGVVVHTTPYSALHTSSRTAGFIIIIIIIYIPLSGRIMFVLHYCTRLYVHTPSFRVQNYFSNRHCTWRHILGTSIYVRLAAAMLGTWRSKMYCGDWEKGTKRIIVHQRKWLLLAWKDLRACILQIL